MEKLTDIQSCFENKEKASIFKETFELEPFSKSFFGSVDPIQEWQGRFQLFEEESISSKSEHKSFILKVRTLDNANDSGWGNNFAKITTKDFFKKDPVFIFNFLKKVCKYSIRPENLKKKDKEAIVLSEAGNNALLIISSLKGDLNVSERALDKLAFWTTRKKNSPMEFFYENKLNTKIRIGSAGKVGAIPVHFSAAELCSFILLSDRLPTVEEANLFFKNHKKIVETEREFQ